MSSATATLSSGSGSGRPGEVPTTRRAPWARVGRAYLDVVSGRTWRATANLVVGMFVGIVSFTVLITLLATTLGLILVLPMAIVTGALTLVLSRVFGRFERFRYRCLLDLDIARPHRPLPAAGWWPRLKSVLLSGATWREMGHGVLQLPIGVLTYVFAVVVWCVPLSLLTLPATVWALPGDEVYVWPDVTLRGWAVAAPAFVLGLVLLPLVPVAIRLVALLDGQLARVLLGPGRTQQLDAQVAALTDSRSRVVDAVEVERQRIERDLHDGAQQRLVALAMDLGRAREKWDTDPAGAQLLVEDAHREAKQALVELRDLARGIHPAVLTDRGLDAALSSVAARSPVPVHLSVDVPRRPSATIEGIAYFVVCEALTNVAKHADATRTAVTVARRGDRLLVEITDDGHGGASESGGGLAGLRDRIEGVDGWMHVSSPIGGPTTILAELPCGS
ncbi:MAG: sensor histidine kinase [Acidimicrobiales bacterium]